MFSIRWSVLVEGSEDQPPQEVCTRFFTLCYTLDIDYRRMTLLLLYPMIFSARQILQRLPTRGIHV